MGIFHSFRSTVTPFVPRHWTASTKLLVDPITGAPTGIQNPNANGADGIWAPVDLTAAQIASPSAEMLADLNAVFRLNVAPYTRYRSDGAGLVAGANTNTALDVIAKIAPVARLNNPRVNPVMASPPAITQSSSADGTLTNITLWNDPTASVFNFYGGAPTGVVGNAFATFLCVTVTGVFAPATHRVETVADAIKVQYKLFNPSGKVVRFIVDGQYLSLTPTTLANTGTTYITLDFTAVGGRATRDIIIEGAGSSFGGVAVGPTEGLTKPVGTVRRLAIVGGSYAAGGGASIVENGFANILPDLLGIRDIWNSGIGGTGFTANGTTQTTYLQRISDIVAAAPDIIMCEGSRNDNTATSAQIIAAVTAYVAAVRQQVSPRVPIVIFGAIPGGGVTLISAQAVETAVASAVATIGDPRVRFVPCANSPSGPYLTGTGNIGAPTGSGNCDVYISGSDHVHPIDAGHAYLARCLADDMMGQVFTP
jgi:lysophospholipase L1-like esterase